MSDKDKMKKAPVQVSSSAEAKQSEAVEEQIQQAADKLNIKVEWARGITPEDLLYLLDHCPFLQIVDTAPAIKLEPDPLQLVQAKSGWTIHNYGDAMSSSPGKLLFGGYYRVNEDDEEDEGGSGGGYLHGIGTVHGQAYLTAAEMVELAHQSGWKGIQIVDGHPKMMRMAWIKAKELALEVEGFSPTHDDERVEKIVSMSANELEVLRKQVSKPSL